MPPQDIVRTIYFPIKYDASLCKYRQEGGYYYGGSGAGWHTVSVRSKTEQDSLRNWEDLKQFFSNCRMLMENADIQLGIFPIITVGNDRYMEYSEPPHGHFAYGDENETFWHGIWLAGGTKNCRRHCGITLTGIIPGRILILRSRNGLTQSNLRRRGSAFYGMDE